MIRAGVNRGLDMRNRRYLLHVASTFVATLIAISCIAQTLRGADAVPTTGPSTSTEKVDVFTARANGYATCRIPGIVVTKAGTLLAYCEARKSAKGDWGPTDLLLRRSTDAGVTWS